MRPALLVTLLLAGCSCGSSHTRDGGSVPLDGEPSDGGGGGLGDAALDGGRGDCGEYARAFCAGLDSCYREMIWIYGSIERCETHLRGTCEYESSLEDVGDFAGVWIACLEEYPHCEPWHEGVCPSGSGSRGAGEPCRSHRQCAEGLECFRDERVEMACDTGTCRARLLEGAADCAGGLEGDRCAEGLRCLGEGDARVCTPYEPPGEGEACSYSGECGRGLYCGAELRCMPYLANGAACDPTVRTDGFDGPCGGSSAFECDPGTSTCALLDYAFEGEACGGDGGARCQGPCVSGVCTALDGWIPPGAPCEGSSQCGSYLCIDGVCAPEPCD